MNSLASGFCSRLALRLALTGVSAGLLAGCANSERLADAFSNPFDAPIQSAPPASESGQGNVAANPVSPVQSRPLSAPVASYPAISKPAPAAVLDRVPAAARSYAGWSAEGGSPITVAQGETAEILAKRYGIPVDALVRANGFASASEVQPGTNLVVPVYNAALAASSGAHPAAVPAHAATAASPTRAPVQALREPPPHERPAAKLAAAQVETPLHRPSETHAEPKPVAPHRPEPVKFAALPKPEPVKVATLPKPEPAKPEPAKAALAKAPSGKETAKNLAAATKPEAVPEQPKKQEVKKESVKAAKAEASMPSAKQPVEEAPPAAASEAAKAGPDSANPEFRWPARGRIIQGFKPGGNDGINIAVPEGTSVKAAESGVVAYAGNELKGYGNLVLIRHPNGFVSAYANNGDLEVKRGDTVKRGQVIAKSGQSGNVASPQLHFELRKGATPVDPTQYLAGL